MYKVIDNFLPEYSFKTIEDICVTGSTLPWFLTETVYPRGGVLVNSEISFANTMLKSEFSHDATYATISSIISTGLGFQGINIEDSLFRIRVALQIPLPLKTNKVNSPHIDFNDIPHKVFILYLNNSDGDTVIYNEKHDLSSGECESQILNDVTEMARITPKRNRAVIFDGGVYHASSTPTNTSNRIVLNCNFN